MDAVDLAVETTKQLITLSSAILALAFAFLKDHTPDTLAKRRALNSAVAAHFLAIVAGIWTLMSVTGSAATATVAQPIDIFKLAVTLPSTLQILLFVIGMMMMLVAFMMQNATAPKD